MMAPFLLACSFFLIQILTAKAVNIIAFAPFLILLFRSTPMLSCLWTAFFCGLIVDLLSFGPFGVFSLTYTVTCMILYKQRKTLQDDHLVIFSLFNTAFSIIFTTLHIALLFMLGSGFPLNFSLLFVDIILYSFLDGLYALFWFYLPLKFFSSSFFKIFFRKKA